MKSKSETKEGIACPPPPQFFAVLDAVPNTDTVCVFYLFSYMKKILFKIYYKNALVILQILQNAGFIRFT